MSRGHRCIHCGRHVSITVEGDRGITTTFAPSGTELTILPVIFECDEGHREREWLSPEEAFDLIARAE